MKECKECGKTSDAVYAICDNTGLCYGYNGCCYEKSHYNCPDCGRDNYNGDACKCGNTDYL